MRNLLLFIAAIATGVLCYFVAFVLYGSELMATGATALSALILALFSLWVQPQAVVDADEVQDGKVYTAAAVRQFIAKAVQQDRTTHGCDP
jgi:hypothetical protein